MVGLTCGLDWEDKKFIQDFGGETVGHVKVDLREVGCEGEWLRERPSGFGNSSV
jgi:hypothetical protein